MQQLKHKSCKMKKVIKKANYQEKEVAYQKLNNMLDYVEKTGQVCACLWIIAIGIFLMIGILFDKWNVINLSKQFSNLVAIIVVMWTFTLSVSLYLLGKLEQRYYGIRMIDIMLNDLGKRRIFLISFLVLFLLGILIAVTILECGIGIIFVSFWQFYLMIYILLLVVLKASYTNVRNVIEQELMLRLMDRKVPGKGLNKPIFFTMLKNIDYEDDEEIERLKFFLRQIVLVKLRERISNACQSSRRSKAERKWQILFCAEVTITILRGIKNRTVTSDLLRYWADDKGKPHLEVKLGILMGIMQEMTPETQMFCKEMLRTEREMRRELCIWYVVYNIYMYQYNYERYRMEYAKSVVYTIRNRWNEKDILVILDYLNMLTKSSKSKGLVLKYIFKWEGN